MQKIALITANLSGIDSNLIELIPQQELPLNSALDIFSYKDENFPPRINALHPRLQSKIPKMLGFEYHPGYDYYIWLDGSIKIHSSETIKWLISCCGNNDMAVFRHPFRNSIRDELNYMVNLMQDNNSYLLSRYLNEPIIEQVEIYESDFDFKDECLYALGAFVYNKTVIPKGILNNWFYHNARYSIQDQLSFPYLLTKHQIQISVIDKNIFQNPYFAVVGHKTLFSELKS
jgi:hypothetical protein